MVKVINSSFTTHKIRPFIRSINPKTNKTQDEYYLEKEYIFERRENEESPATETKVGDEDFIKLIDDKDYTKAKIYTLEQHELRAEKIKEEKLKNIKFQQSTGREQEKLARTLVPTSEVRYLIGNDLPYASEPLEKIMKRIEGKMSKKAKKE